MKIELKSYVGDKKIILEHKSDFDTIRSQIVKKIIDTEDQMVRDGLIKLGWTPPKDKYEKA